jgi:hypothetical protein
MNIYLLTYLDKCDYDEYDSFVVAANDRDEACQLAQDKAGERNHEPGKSHFDPTLTPRWTSDRVACQLVGASIDGSPRILCGSFNAG